MKCSLLGQVKSDNTTSSFFITSLAEEDCMQFLHFKEYKQGNSTELSSLDSLEKRVAQVGLEPGT